MSLYRDKYSKAVFLNGGGTALQGALRTSWGALWCWKILGALSIIRGCQGGAGGKMLNRYTNEHLPFLSSLRNNAKKKFVLDTALFESGA